MNSTLRPASSGLALSLLLSACVTQGPDQIVADRFDYNNAVATSANEQMLLNLVRLRYSDIPTFLQVNSVLTQYIWSGSIGADANGGSSMGFDQWSVGAGGTLRYIERPTITYTPLTGEEFAQQLTTPIPTELIFSLVQSGWPPEQLLAMGIQRIQDQHNITAFPMADPDRTIERFRETLRLFVEIALRGGVESQPSTDEENVRVLLFSENVDPETQQLIDDFKTAIGLDAAVSSFKITRRFIGREPDEVTVRIRSVLDIMGYLSLGVEAPPEHLDNGRVVQTSGSFAQTASLIPLHVRHSAEPPVGAFVAVRYEDHWFHIPNSDQRSKQSFSMLSYLFQMQAPRIQGAGPLVTVPTG